MLEADLAEAIAAIKPADGGQAAEAATPSPGDPLPSPAEPGQTPRPVDGADVMVRIGRAYVDFACAHPEQLQVMFRPRHHDSEGPPPPALAEIGAQAYGHLADAVRACQAQGLAPAGDPGELTLSAWSLVHGFGSLWCQGQLGALIPGPEQFARQRDQLLRNLQAGWKATAAAPAAPAAPAAQIGSAPKAVAPHTV